MRLFVGLSLADEVAQSLLLLNGGIPGARWMNRDQLHLTLRFIGEVDGLKARDIDDALMTIAAPGFLLELHTVGTFGGREPRQLWAGVRPNPALMHLQKKIETALQRVGLAPEPRKFTPHVTIARLKAVAKPRLIEYLSHHALYASAGFDVATFQLFRSTLTPNGSIYTAERSYSFAS